MHCCFATEIKPTSAYEKNIYFHMHLLVYAHSIGRKYLKLDYDFEIYVEL